MDEDIICEECGMQFMYKKKLYAHLRNIHKYSNTNRIFKELCHICGQQFVNKQNYTRHLKQFHKISASNEEDFPISRIICSFEDCCEYFKNYDCLRKHLTSAHKVEIEFSEFEFESFLAFDQWKNQVQERSLSLYVVQKSRNLLSGKKEFYNCHRSYAYAPKGKGLRAPKGKGTNKIGKACPSRMEVVVKFWMTHVGHSLDIGRVFLSKEMRAVIAGKLKEGVTLEHILDHIRDAGVTKESQRLLLLEKKDLHNIKRDFHIDNIKHHHNDAISVKLWVEKMKSNDECPVLLFKDQGIECDLGILDINDFALIIMTSFQAQQLLQFGHDKICIDGTHGTSSFDFQLYTLMTVDELGSGSPVAFCFSNRADEIIFNVFFENVKLKVGIIQANVFMSDDAPAFYNAWSHIMSPVPNKLLCTWHVDRNWRHNLSKINGGTEKKALVYKALRVLLQSTSTEHFNDSLTQVLSHLYADPDTVSFAQYFNDFYANRPQCWAYCFRLGLGIGINTNMYLESLHKILKHIYLDKSINAVMKIARDSLFKRLIKLAKNSPTDKRKRIRESHTLSRKIQKDMIERLENENEFLVTSAADKSQKYLVIKIDEDCTDLCLRCHEYKICLHSFKCSCIDNVKLNICKHIHACKSFFFSNADTIVFNTENDNAVKEVLQEVNTSCQVQSSSVTTQEIKRRAELVIGLCDTTSLSDEEHRTILSSFDNIISIMNKQKAIIHLDTKHKINSNSKIENQVRLFSTKKRKLKEVSKFKKPTIIEEKNIMDSLLNKTDVNVNIHTQFDHTYTL